MPRHKRLNIAGSVYHVITRGIERREIFKDDADRKEFLGRLEAGIKKTGCRCYAWVLMPNHLHLVIRTGAQSLSELMRGLLCGYAAYFNHRHKRRGYLYQNRYKSILCQEEVYLLELIRYIHLNPLRAKLANNLSSLDNYEWSGHTALIGRRNYSWQDIEEVLGRFGTTRTVAAVKYREFVRDGLNMGRRDDLTGGGLKRSAGGWSGVYDLKRNKEYWRSDERILGDGEFVNNALKVSEEEMERREKLRREGWNLERLTKYVCELLGLEREELKRKGKNNKVSWAKGLISFWGRSELGINGREIGNFLGVSRQAVAYSVIQGEKTAKKNKYLFNQEDLKSAEVCRI